MYNYKLINKIYNELLKREGLDPDKYEREDAFFGIAFDVEKGKDLVETIKNTFNLVHARDLNDAEIKSCIALCEGFNPKKADELVETKEP